MRDGESGFLVEEGDVDGMAKHMLRLVRIPNWPQGWGPPGGNTSRATIGLKQPRPPPFSAAGGGANGALKREKVLTVSSSPNC